ncbi:MAG: ChaN family lipoprotein [Prolixibacteraceae bacterium]|nr:ChaN family lipoprotein [Prolixibacteraceae bacterium]
MKKISLMLIAAFFISTAFKSGNPAYLLFNKEGKEVKYNKIIKSLLDADIVLFGEQHNNPISHWLQLEITEDLYGLKKDSLILAAEMFETDNQLILDEYTDSLISTSSFEAQARLWPNYKTDYKPLVELARKNGLKFIASNVPRQYASLVNSNGFEGLEELSDEGKKLIPPLPIPYDPELECYKSMMQMEGMGSHVTPNFPKAQAIKDATMAYSILKFWSPGKTVIHYNGSYHSDNFGSINWYLKHWNPDLKIVTITTVAQENVSELSEENSGKADFTICVKDNMTTTR